MQALMIEGPTRLKGKVSVSGSKNTALPFLFASLLFDQKIHFSNVPRLWDIETTLDLLGVMGSQCEWDKDKGTIAILPKVETAVAPYELVKKMRAGILALCPMVARVGHAKVSLPGGCAIGARPVNFHLEGLRQMGAEVDVDGGYILAKVKGRLHGAHLQFPDVSVTGTENLMVAASVAKGETLLENAAREPEVVAVGELLRSAGVPIEGLGTSVIRIQGVESLKAPSQPVPIPPDRIETGTFIAAALVTRSEVVIEKCAAGELEAVIEAFRELGANINVSDNGQTITVKSDGELKPSHVSTEPYPGFPTDMQAQMMMVMCTIAGKSSMRENIFENRFMHVAELRRLGAKIKIDGNLALIDGGHPLKGAPIMATDLRASASLVLAGLAAEGATKVSRIYHLDRGYQRLDEKLTRLGATIRRIDD